VIKGLIPTYNSVLGKDLTEEVSCVNLLLMLSGDGVPAPLNPVAARGEPETPP